MDLLDLAYALVGVGALLAGLLPRLLADRPCPCRSRSSALGMLVFALPLGLPDAGPAGRTPSWPSTSPRSA